MSFTASYRSSRVASALTERSHFLSKDERLGYDTRAMLATFRAGFERGKTAMR